VARRTWDKEAPMARKETDNEHKRLLRERELLHAKHKKKKKESRNWNNRRNMAFRLNQRGKIEAEEGEKNAERPYRKFMGKESRTRKMAGRRFARCGKSWYRKLERKVQHCEREGKARKEEPKNKNRGGYEKGKGFMENLSSTLELKTTQRISLTRRGVPQ